jgi:hypothetical protein
VSREISCTYKTPPSNRDYCTTKPIVLAWFTIQFLIHLGPYNPIWWTGYSSGLVHVEALFLFALLFASFAQCKYTSQRCLFFHSLWFVTRNNATGRQQWSEFGSTRSYRNNDTSNGEIDTTTSDEGKIKVTFCALRPVLPVGTRGATAAWMESGVMTMYYNIDESWLVFVKTDKISLNRFCWFIENQSNRFFLKIWKIWKKSNQKNQTINQKNWVTNWKLTGLLFFHLKFEF